MNRYLFRIFSLILSAAILFSVLVVPAAASSYDGASDVTDTYWVDMLDIGYNTNTPLMGNLANVSSTATSARFTYQADAFVTFSAFDIVIKSDGDVSGITFQNLTFDAVRVGVEDLGTNLFRVYGNYTARRNSFPFTVSFGSGTSFVEIVQLRLLTADAYCYPAPSNLYINNGFTEYTFNDSTGYSTIGTFFTVNDIGQEDPVLWDVQLRSYDWYKYDRLEFYIRCRIDMISYITVESESGDISFPFSVTYLKDDNGEFSWPDSNGDIVSSTYKEIEAIISVDLSSIPHDNDNFNYYPVVRIGGQWMTQWIYNDGPVRYFYLDAVRGYVAYKSYDKFLMRLDQISTWCSNIYYVLGDLFNELISTIVNVMNPEPDSMMNAMDSQMEVNVQVNAMVSDSIDEWDTYHVQVSDGATEGIQKSLPALEWLSSIADGVYTQMGWFANMYLFAGFCTLYFLIMSKAGIGSKISVIKHREFRTTRKR